MNGQPVPIFPNGVDLSASTDVQETLDFSQHSSGKRGELLFAVPDWTSWIKSSCAAPVVLLFTQDGLTSIGFVRPEDAVLFKLKWIAE